MFSHEVIKSLRRYYKSLPKQSEAYEVLKDLTRTIWDSHKFHFGDAHIVTDLVGITGRKMNEGKALSDPIHNDLILPYHFCWFDYFTRFDEKRKIQLDSGEIVKIQDYIKQENLSTSFKKGFLVKEDIPGSLFSSINFYSDENYSTKWLHTPIVYFISLGQPIRFNIEACELIHRTLGITFSRKDIQSMINTIGDSNIFPAPMYDADIISEYMDKTNAQVDMINLDLVEAAICLLNCQGIVTEVVDAKQKVKVGKKIKNKKLGYTYKVLDVLMPPDRKEYINSEDTGRRYRQHICKKHYRHYTDKGLFGKYYGRFLIPAHKRGSRAVGKVDKDYNIKT